MADDEAKVLAAAKKLPIRERLEHKVWKVRGEACDEIIAQAERSLGETDSNLGTLAELLPKAVADANANVMDKALEAALAVLSRGSEKHAGCCAEGVCKVIASKVLTARVGTIKKAEELVLVLVEQEQGAVVVEALISGFGHKVPKAVAAAVNMALSVYTEFGAKAVKPQPMLKALPGLFDSKDAKIRDAAKNLTVVLGHWVGRELVETTLVEKMRDAMKKDVAELLSDLPAEKPKAARLTRKEAAKKAAAAAAKQVAVAPTEGEEGVDAAAGGVPTAVAVAVDDDDDDDGAVDSYEFAEPQDICREIKAAFYTGLESKKWQERKGALVSLKELARTPRIAPGEFSDVNTGLRKIISKDSNVVCVAEAVQCAGLLAKGLRPGYRNAALQFVPLLLDKFKDKNTNLVNACHGSLGYMATHCVSLGDIMDDLQTALKHANPKVKQETLKFIHATLLAMDAAHSKKLQKALLPLLVKGAGEATPALREAAMGCIAEMAAKAGSLAPFESAIDKLDDAKKAKLISMAQAAISGEPLTAAPPSPTVGPSPKGAPRPSSGRPSTAASKTPAAVARPATAKPSKSAAPAKEEKETEDPVALSSAALTGDEAIVKFAEVAGDGTITELKSTNWKQRLDAMVELLERMQGDTAGKADALVFGVAALPGWGEKNFQVMGKCFEVGRMCAEDPSSGYGKAHAFSTTSGVVEKMSDAKLKGVGCAALSAACEAVGPAFVINQLFKKAAGHNNPKVLAETLDYIKTTILEFGLPSCGKSLVDHAKVALESPNAGVRNAATKMLGAMHQTLGPALADVIRPSVKPALMSAIESEFASSAGPPPEPVRVARAGAGVGGKKAGAASNGGGETTGNAKKGPKRAAAVDAADDLLPKTDISGRITPKLVKELGSSVWKERNGAVEQVNAIIAEAGRVSPSTGELLPALKARLTDSNRNLAAGVMITLATLCKAMGPPFVRESRMLLDGVAKCLGDNKKPVRDAALGLMDALLDVGAGSVVFHEIADELKTLKVEGGKLETLNWLSAKVSDGFMEDAQCTAFTLKVAVSGVEDKLSTVRAAGTALLEEMVNVCGGSALTGSLKELDDASRRSAKPHLEKFAAGASPPPAAASRPSAARSSSTASRPSTASAVRRSTVGGLTKGAASRPASARPAIVTPAAADSNAALFLMDEKKDARMKKNRGGFKPLNNRSDEVAELEASLAPQVAQPLHKLMFHKDCAKHIDACEQIMAGVEEYRDEIVSNLDRVLHWLALRQNDGNTQCLLRVLDTVSALFSDLDANDTVLNDYEASIILPALAEKSGHNMDRVRQKYRELLAAAANISRHVKVVDALVEGMRSKNNRSRVECAEELGCIVERHGVGSLKSTGKEKVLPLIAKLVGERDKALRGAALGTLAIVYTSEGDAVWKQLGSLTAPQQSLIEDRFRFTEKEVMRAGGTIGAKREQRLLEKEAAAGGGVAAAQSCASPVRAQPPSSVPMEAPSPAAPRQAAMMQSMSEFPHAVRSAREDAIMRDSVAVGANGFGAPPPPLASHPRTPVVPAHPAPPTPGAAPSPMLQATPNGGAQYVNNAFSQGERTVGDITEQWARGMVLLHSARLPDAVEGMKVLCYELMEASRGACRPGVAATFGDSADELVAQLTVRVDEVFDEATAAMEADGVPPSSRSCKYVLNTLMQTFQFQSRGMALRVGGAAVEALIGTLLVRLLDDRVPGLQEGAQLLKALNVLMLKILENSSRTHTFNALLGLLRCPPVALERMGGTPGASQKFSDLVVKCLIKLTKALATFIDELDVTSLLATIHAYFAGLGVEEIRRRGQEDDKPLRMVKTILHEVCKVEGHAVHAHLAAAVPADADSIIHNYVNLNLQTLQAAGLIKPPPTPPPALLHHQLRVTLPTSGPPTPGAQGVTPQQHHPPAPTTPYMTPGSVTPPGSAAVTPGRAASPAGAVPSQEAKQQLAAIFKKIGDKNTTERGLEELYFFQAANPHIDISFHLSKTSDAFRRYIQSGLDKVGARQAAQAQTAQQPESVQTSGGGEEEDSSSAALQERMERLKGRFAQPLAGGAAPAANLEGGRVGSQNLDELRERMKHISSQMPQPQ